MANWLNTRRGESAPEGKQKKQGINRRGGDPRIESNTGTATPTTTAAQAVVPQALLSLPAEIFTVGGQKLTYKQLVKKYEVEILKVLMVSDTTTVEAHNYDTDGNDCGRMSAAEEKAFITRMHKTRVEEAAKSGGYAIPEVKIAPRNDTNVLDEIPTEALAQALRARGVNVTPEQIQEASRPQIDPEVAALMSSTGMTQEQAEQAVQAIRAARNNPQPAGAPAAPVVPPTTPPAGGAGPGRGF